MSKILELQEELYQLKQERNDKDVENKLMQQKLAEVKEENKMLKDDVDHLKSQVESINEQFETMHMRLEHVEQSADQSQMPFVGDGVRMRRE